MVDNIADRTRALDGNLENTSIEQQRAKEERAREYVDYIIMWRAGAIANRHGAGASSYQKATQCPNSQVA